MSSPWPFQTQGTPNHPPLLFLHGFLGQGEDWLRIANALGEKYFCIMPDLPGHGNNLLYLQTSLSFERLNEGLCELLDSLSISKIHLVGYSMGGRAALYFAIHHPERIHSLTLESTSPGITNPDERRARAREDDHRADSILTQGIEPFVELWYSLPLFRSLENYPDIRAQVVARRKKNDPASVAKVISDLSPGRQPSVWDQLSSLEMPTLLIIGALDEKYVALGEKMSALIPNTQRRVIPASGHTTHLEQLDSFSSVLSEFLDTIGTIFKD